MNTSQSTWCILVLSPSDLEYRKVLFCWSLPLAPAQFRKYHSCLFFSKPQPLSLQAKGRFQKVHFLILGDCCNFFPWCCRCPSTISTPSTQCGLHLGTNPACVRLVISPCLSAKSHCFCLGACLLWPSSPKPVALLIVSAVLFQFVLIWLTESMEKLIGGEQKN